MRNRRFFAANKRGLVGGGKVELRPDGKLKCTWLFEKPLPKMGGTAESMLNAFTKSLRGRVH